MSSLFVVHGLSTHCNICLQSCQYTELVLSHHVFGLNDSQPFKIAMMYRLFPWSTDFGTVVGCSQLMFILRHPGSPVFSSG